MNYELEFADNTECMKQNITESKKIYMSNRNKTIREVVASTPPAVQMAFAPVENGDCLTLGDVLVLEVLGVNFMGGEGVTPLMQSVTVYALLEVKRGGGVVTVEAVRAQMEKAKSEMTPVELLRQSQRIASVVTAAFDVGGGGEKK